jgi:hypothetical protein
MTMINCSSKCIHQNDGKCMLEEAISETISTGTDCVFYNEKHVVSKSSPIDKEFCEL